MTCLRPSNTGVEKAVEVDSENIRAAVGRP